MVINNKLEGNSELVGIKSSEKSSDIDALFAELFALVNLDSIDSKKTSFKDSEQVFDLLSEESQQRFLFNLNHLR